MTTGHVTATRRMMHLSGTSVSSPAVAGAAALMLQVNPKLTPNLVKAILMYTAQQLPGFNTFEQGAGQVNLEGAMRLARLVRTDLTSTTPVGSSMRWEEVLLPRQGLQRQWQLGLHGGRQRDDAHEIELSPRVRAAKSGRAGV